MLTLRPASLKCRTNGMICPFPIFELDHILLEQGFLSSRNFQKRRPDRLVVVTAGQGSQNLVALFHRKFAPLSGEGRPLDAGDDRRIGRRGG